MATYSRTVLEIQRVEFHVPAPAPWGADWVEVMKAVAAATNELAAAGRVLDGDDPAADMIAIAPTDDGIVVSYEVRTRG